jgi:hypothetical protein
MRALLRGLLRRKPKLFAFSLKLEFEEGATIASLVAVLRATADRIERGDAPDALLVDVGAFREFYDVRNPSRSYARRG